MLKLLTFTLFLLCLTFSVHSRSCEIEFYGPPPPPECETIIENGEEIEACSAVGAPASRLLLDASKPRYSEANTTLVEVYFYGYCRCSIKLWTKANFRGDWILYPFCRSKNKEILTDAIWKKPNNSFRISCVF